VLGSAGLAVAIVDTPGIIATIWSPLDSPEHCGQLRHQSSRSSQHANERVKCAYWQMVIQNLWILKVTTWVPKLLPDDHICPQTLKMAIWIHDIFISCQSRSYSFERQKHLTRTCNTICFSFPPSNPRWFIRYCHYKSLKYRSRLRSVEILSVTLSTLII
jgi:hypothetical protein